MSGRPVTGSETGPGALYHNKARAEIESAESLVAQDHVRGAGDVMADVLLVKGEPGEADRASGRALAGADGQAVHKALDALGLSDARYAVCSRVRPRDVRECRARLRLLVEAVDPRGVGGLAEDAAADFGEALSAVLPEPGVMARIGGRAVVVVDNFAASLGDEDLKRRVWRQLQALRDSDHV